MLSWLAVRRNDCAQTVSDRTRINATAAKQKCLLAVCERKPAAGRAQKRDKTCGHQGEIRCSPKKKEGSTPSAGIKGAWENRVVHTMRLRGQQVRYVSTAKCQGLRQGN